MHKYLLVVCALVFIGCVEQQPPRFYKGQKVKVLGRDGVIFSHSGSGYSVNYVDEFGKIHFSCCIEESVIEERQ